MREEETKSIVIADVLAVIGSVYDENSYCSGQCIAFMASTMVELIPSIVLIAISD
jgi:hypothetical protein